MATLLVIGFVIAVLALLLASIFNPGWLIKAGRNADFYQI
jgi:hypothetical protein